MDATLNGTPLDEALAIAVGVELTRRCGGDGARLKAVFLAAVDFLKVQRNHTFGNTRQPSATYFGWTPTVLSLFIPPVVFKLIRSLHTETNRIPKSRGVNAQTHTKVCESTSKYKFLSPCSNFRDISVSLAQMAWCSSFWFQHLPFNRSRVRECMNGVLLT